MRLLKKLFRRTFLRKIRARWLARPVRNLFGASPKAPRALISYSVFLIRNRQKLSHPNHHEIACIAKALAGLGYAIDVMNNTDARKIDYRRYSLIVGEGLPISGYFSAPAERKSASTLTIYYATGSHPYFQNAESAKRVFAFAGRYGAFLPESGRMLDARWAVGASLSDVLVFIGNAATLETFVPWNQSRARYALDPPAYFKKDIRWNPRKSPRKFLWFGSFGLIHKGLDTAIEAFAERPDLELHVCGKFDAEKSFFEVMRPVCERAPNVVFHGFLSVLSPEFDELLETCAFTLLASCAEGSATGVVTVMGNGGLIPVVNRRCGLDMENAIEVHGLEKESVLAAVDAARAIDAETLSRMSESARLFARKRFSEDVFEASLERIFRNIVPGGEGGADAR